MVILTEDEMMEEIVFLEIPFASCSVGLAANGTGEAERIFVFLKVTSFDQRVGVIVSRHDPFDVVEKESERIGSHDGLEMILEIWIVVVQENCERVKDFWTFFHPFVIHD